MHFFQAMRGVLAIIALISVGFVLRRRGFFDQKAAKLFSATVLNVSLPAYMVSNLTGTFDRAAIEAAAPNLAIPIATNVACLCVAWALSLACGLPHKRRGVFRATFALSNTIFVGLPVNAALFGPASLPYALLYYIATTIFFWTLGTYWIARDGDPQQAKLFSLKGLRNILSPPFCGFLVGVSLVMLGVRLPDFAADALRYLGSLTTPLSMLFIGMLMATVDRRTLRLDWSVGLVMAGRFAVAPGIAFLLCRLAGTPPLMEKVFVIQAAMPAMTTTSIVAEGAGADSEYAATIVTATTVVSLLSIPAYMALLGG